MDNLLTRASPEGQKPPSESALELTVGAKAGYCQGQVMKNIPTSVRQYFSEQGTKGGQSSSPAKVEAVRKNLAKARTRRWKHKPTQDPAA